MKQPEKKYHLYGVGSALLDMEVDIDDVFCVDAGLKKGCMALTDKTQQEALLAQLNQQPANIKHACGGSAANTIISNSCFGGQSFFSCMLGQDEYGDIYLDNLNAMKIHNNVQIVDTGDTGRCLVMITPDGERTMMTSLGVNAELSTNIIDEHAISISEYLYLEGYLVGTACNLRALQHACVLAEKHQTKIAFSLSDPSIVTDFEEEIKMLLASQQISLLFCNEEELLTYTKQKDLSKALDIASKHVTHIVATRGAEGAVIQRHGNRVHIKAYPTQVINTNGAGDMFAGAYLYGICHQFDTQHAGSFAAFCGAYLVSCHGPRLKAEKYAQLLHEFKAQHM